MISVCIPTIRPEKAKRCIDAVLAEGIPVEILAEEDTERIGAPKMLKRMVEKSTGDMVMFLGDDTIPKPGFINAALKSMATLPDGWGVVGLNSQKSRHAAHFLADKRMLPLLGGEFFNTVYHHCFCDNELSDIASENKRFVFCDEAVVIHDHPVFTGEAGDADLAHEAGLRNVLVTAGYINPEPWKRLLEFVDAANIDLKGITEEFYREVCSATLQPVLNALVLAKANGVLVEVTNLLIPTLNDKPEEIRELSRWIKANLGGETPLHFSRFFPRHKMLNLPPTSLETLELARRIAIEEGLQYVYIGNIAGKEGQNTYCPACKALLLERSGYTILQNNLKNGTCPKCGNAIYGVWK